MKRYSLPFFFILLLVTGSAVFAQNQAGDSSSHRKIITDFFQLQGTVKYIHQCALNPSASAIAWCAENENGRAIFIKRLSGTDSSTVPVTAAAGNVAHNESEPQWSPGGKEIAFLSDAQSPDQLQLFIADAATGALITKQPLTRFNGYVSHLQWSPDGKYLSVLYVEKASREPSPMAAENRATGVIDSMINSNVQRIAIVNRATSETKIVTPATIYIFEYDWSPDSQSFVYTAAAPPGDDNWYIAKLCTQTISSNDTVVVYKPRLQIAVPRWSPDGKQIAFIEGLMSDQGGTGGDLFIINANNHAKAINLTQGRKSSPAWFTWQPGGNILFTEFIGGSVGITTLNVKSKATTIAWKADASIRASADEASLSVINNRSSPAIAFIRHSWNELPEIWYGNLSQQARITHLNDAVHRPLLRTENLVWTNEGKRVQGWLLFPENYDSTKHYPMVVNPHGGPAWVFTPMWYVPDFNTSAYTRLGYFVFFPNARGSHGQGEAFTQANKRDWGFGDMRDITSGVDYAVSKFPIAKNRVGLCGWSYGGVLAMFATTQNYFRAAVSGAGACDWLSYYGQNSIDKWMQSYFDVSPYDNPAVYAKISPITYIKKARTPTLMLVGERDGECPAPQSFQFWHALKELKVPTQLVVYADEGHSFRKMDNIIDVSVRTIEWFDDHMKP